MMKIWIELDVSDDFETSMDMQKTIEAEIMADRWAWHKTPPELTACRDALLKEGVRIGALDKVRLRNLLGSVDIEVDGGFSDNLAIALATYFDTHPSKPQEVIDYELGWTPWVIGQCNKTLDSVATEAMKYLTPNAPSTATLRCK